MVLIIVFFRSNSIHWYIQTKNVMLEFTWEREGGK